MMLFGIGLALMTAGGLAALFPGRARLVHGLGAAGMLAGDVFAAIAAILGLSGGMGSEVYVFNLPLPMGEALFALSPLSSYFVLMLAVVTALAAVYAPSYLMHHEEQLWKCKGHWLLYALLTASMMLVVSARNAVSFMLSWEAMSLTSFFLVLFQYEKPEVRRSAWLYFVFAHVGAVCLLVMFSLLAQASGSLDFEAMKAASSTYAPGLKSAVFVLAIFGFGMKAGFFPLHVWLPEAHPAAPSHVSAVMSGVMIKTAVYGLVLAVTLMGGVPAGSTWMGWTLLAIGVMSGIFGIAFAAVQNHAKRLLAYSSVENIGIITMGLGIWCLGSASGRSVMAGLGLMGALLHVLNHALVKSLMFMGAGALQHGAGTLDLDQMGGLLRRMPRTGLAMVAGAVALSGLPPFNGFVGEFLIYASAFVESYGSLLEHALFIIAVLGGLSIIGGIAVFTFAKLVGTGLLGEPRSEAAAKAHEIPAGMQVPMLLLAGACALIGFFPLPVLRFMVPVLADAGLAEPGLALSGIALSLGTIQWISLALLALVGVLALARRRALAAGARSPQTHTAGKVPVASSPTWDCGYHAPTARMQYTASSFAQSIASFAQPVYKPKIEGSIGGELFPAKVRQRIVFRDLVLDRILAPLYARISRAFERFSILQHGNTHWYVLYVVIALLAVLIWSFAL